MPRKSLVQKLLETQALGKRYAEGKARVDRAKREALAPREPQTAIDQYASAMRTYAARVEALVERHVLSTLPVVGSGDELDLEALEGGLQELERRLDALPERSMRTALATGKRISAHGRAEVARMLDVEVPNDLRAQAVTEGFAQQQMERLRKIGRDQVAKIRQYIAEYQEGDSLRGRITHALWVSRNRSQLVARHESLQLHKKNIAFWSTSAGSEWGVYCTRKDELVRPTHAAHEGKVYRWPGPATLEEVNCRCRMVPLEAVLT